MLSLSLSLSALFFLAQGGAGRDPAMLQEEAPHSPLALRTSVLTSNYCPEAKEEAQPSNRRHGVGSPEHKANHNSDSEAFFVQADDKHHLR